MAERRPEDQHVSLTGETGVRPRRRKRQIAAVAGFGLLAVLVIALAVLWTARRPIASNVLEREFERRGVQASYELVRVGLRTQQVRNLVIGDPRKPDLVARFAQVQIRIRLNGSVEVYRIVARGVRLRGRVVRGRVSWGQIDRLLPPPSDKPFALPDFVLDVADSSISLGTPFGPMGIAIEGVGNLSGGFKGRLAAVSPRLAPGRCEATELMANVAVSVTARRPRVQGPVRVDRFRCAASRFEITQPLLDIDSRFNEAFTDYDGRGRMAIRTLVAGENGLANFVGNIGFRGNAEATYGDVELSARQSRLGDIFADRTNLEGRYRLSLTSGRLTMVGDYAANSANLAPSMLAAVTQPLAAARNTPLGPVATAINAAIQRTTNGFDASGEIRMVNFPGGGAARVASTDLRGPGGGRIQISGGDGVTYYWPSGRLRVDGLIRMGGGGLPTGQVLMRQPRSGAPMNGVAQFEPYTAGGSRLALAPIRFAGDSSGATQVSTTVQLDGGFPDGRVRGLRLPLTARIGGSGGFALGQACAEVRWEFIQMRALQLGPTRLPVCPIGPAILTQRPGGGVRAAARIDRPVLAGRLGRSPLRIAAASARIVGDDFTFNTLATRLGRPESPVVFDAAGLNGTFSGRGVEGRFTGARSTIGNVPLQLSEGDGRWRFYRGDLTVDSALTVSDRNPEPRFYPLRSDDVRLTLADGDRIRATGTLRHPASGTRVTDVAIEHRLETGAGHALLDVPGITFGENLQPEELTRLSEGVIALVQGTVTGQGRINWSGSGEVTSTGEFSTANMDLAAPFGPVTGLNTTIRFTDLLNLETAPGQTATIGTINPGILVENGVIRYQLLPNQLVKIERGEWPFMGGRLILHETILNFGRPSPKRLTFEVVGFDAKQFTDSFGFQGLEITGIFDGVLPMIFDESGGRIVGGRLDSRPPGGQFAYNGTKPDAGLMVGVAFDLLSNIRYRSMIIRLDGDLAGEFATRFTINEVSLGNRGGMIAGLVRGAFKKVPLRVNLSIRGPFRALIGMAKGFKDPTDVIQPVMPFPLDAPGVVVETRVLRKDEEQERLTPIDEVDVSTQRPQPSE